MATIHKLTKDGATIFPATITDAVVHPQTGKTLTSMMKDYNVSELFPTEGIDGGNKYTLALAIQVLGTHLSAEQKTGGIKLTFISSVSPYPEEEYYLGKSQWSASAADWDQRFEVGEVIADPSGSWKPSTAEAYIDQQVGNLSTSIASETIARQTGDNNLSTQLTSEINTRASQDANLNALINAGIREGGGVQFDIVPTQNSANGITSGGMYSTLRDPNVGFVDEMPTTNSNNLVKSSGTNKAILNGALILASQLFDNNCEKVILPAPSISGIYQYLSDGTSGISRNTTSNYALTQFIELKGATKIHFKGHHTSLSMSVAPVLFYDINYNFISGINIENLSSSEYDEFERPVPSGAIYARFCSRTDVSEFRVDAISFINYETPSVTIPDVINDNIDNSIKTQEMIICNTVIDKNGKIGNINEPTFQQQVFTDGFYIIGSDGKACANNSYIGTDYIYIRKLKTLTWRGYLSTNTTAVAAVAFYDENKGFISSISVGQSGSGATYTTEQSLIENIAVPNNAVYCRCCCHYRASKYLDNHPFSLTTFNTENFRAIDILYLNDIITPVKSLIKNNPDVDTDMVYIFDKILCIGDSVTEGHVYDYPRTPVNGTVYHQYSYPAMLSQMLNGKIVENAGHSGISASGWWNNYRGDYDYTLYELVIIELGYNGGLSVNDITTQGTNTYDYRQIINYVKQNNPNAYIVLVISSAFNSDRANAVIEIASRASVPYIDLRQTTYDNLNSDKYHGFDNVEMTDRSYWHFNRIGYLAKARVMLKELNAIIHNRIEEINNYIGV